MIGVRFEIGSELENWDNRDKPKKKNPIPDNGKDGKRLIEPHRCWLYALTNDAQLCCIGCTESRSRTVHAGPEFFFLSPGAMGKSGAWGRR
jgi:hypothetical protein